MGTLETEVPILTVDVDAGMPDLWSSGKNKDELSKQRRVGGLLDKVKASDINELRAYVEVLLTHTHEYEQAIAVVSGTTTTTCG